MLPSALRNSSKLQVSTIFIRSFATETIPSTSSSNSSETLPPPKHPTDPGTTKPRASRLYLSPRPVSSRAPISLPHLPPSFGRNQLLPVSNSTRALLESVVAEFNAPIRYAFAYGSGVFEQDGYTQTKDPRDPNAPMLDFMFAVTHADHFHSINMHQYPSHYPFHSRLLGSDYVSRVQSLGPGVWFNAYVPMKGVTIKYGVTTVDDLCSDLLNWKSLYLAGRMHKPIRIVKDDARVRLTQQVNLTSAVRAALLTLPSEFGEKELFERIAGISYSGDPRMILPAENRGKVGNIVRNQQPQFKELYHRLVVGLPGVHWPSNSSLIQQDTSPQARSAHLRKLPSNLLNRVTARYAGFQDLKDSENAYWTKLSEDETKLQRVLSEETSRIVRTPATVQTLKGIVSAGLGKSLRYSAAKVSKWWKSSGGNK
ncbi:Mmp37-domain-containing protein [Dendrothele bispora CBS 962.96]|uniref:Phosphatidate cytidylyltransferase, mitochondrial n=1 Tax=Dendrothele bispora (strain CBS 962.96) TaxID=1314807 RepID=A0A4S8LEZ3_DENBC|nr:Mmp37-domain-containing protein [Dendrothele bispora CBS 962.96]